MGFKVGDIVKHSDWDELGIVVSVTETSYNNECYVCVYWTSGRRGYWRTGAAHKYLWVIG